MVKKPTVYGIRKSNRKMDLTVDEDIRLTYRYLDLRRQTMQKNRLVDQPSLRYQVLNTAGFLDIETPF